MVEGESESVLVCVRLHAYHTTPRTLPSMSRAHCPQAHHVPHNPTYLGALAAGDALDERVDHGGGAVLACLPVLVHGGRKGGRG